MPKTWNQKEKIFDAGLKLFATQGYGSTSVRLIASTAKVSAPLLYNYYKTKEDLLLDIVQRGFLDIRESMSAYSRPGLTPHQAIEMHVTRTVAILKKHREFWKLLHTIRLQDKVIAVAKRPMREMIEFVTKAFTAIFKKMRYKHPHLEALLFLSQVDGLVILWLQDSSVPIDKLARKIIQRYTK
jgi:AcrR family transcriptional regulator